MRALRMKVTFLNEWKTRSVETKFVKGTSTCKCVTHSLIIRDRPSLTLEWQPRSPSPNLVPRVLSLPTSRKYPGCGWSRVYVYKSIPHRGWVFDLIVSKLSMEEKGCFASQTLFWKLASYLSEILPDRCFVSIRTSVSMRCWLRGKFAHFHYIFK